MKTLITVLLCSLFLSILRAADEKYYSISKMELFDQFTAEPSTLKNGNAYRISATVASASVGKGPLTSVTMSSQSVAPMDMAFDTDANWFNLRQDFPSESALDATFPPEVYSFVINSLNGQRVCSLNLPSSSLLGVYPSAPHISNFPQCQTIPTDADFLVTWDKFNGGGFKDYILLTIGETNKGTNVISSPRLLQPGYLDGYAKSFRIPSGTLEPATTYQAELVFWKGISTDTTNFPGVPGLLVLGSMTGFSITTASLAPTLFKLTAVSYSHAGQITLQLDGKTGAGYRIQQSSDLKAWTNILITNLSVNPMIMVDTADDRNKCRFYRAVQQ